MKIILSYFVGLILTFACASVAMTSCNKHEDRIDESLRTLRDRHDPRGYVVFADPSRNCFVQFSADVDGSINFQSPIKTVYLEGGLKPLCFDVIVDKMPTEGIIETMQTLTPEELLRLKQVLDSAGISYVESIRGGRDPRDGPVRAYMHQIKGSIDPTRQSASKFVNEVFRFVYLYNSPPDYNIKTDLDAKQVVGGKPPEAFQPPR